MSDTAETSFSSVRCPYCGRLLFEVPASTPYRSVCPRCRAKLSGKAIAHRPKGD